MSGFGPRLFFLSLLERGCLWTVFCDLKIFKEFYRTIIQQMF
jgi:hypothetical protein